MKLFELDATRQTRQAAKVFESYFGNRVDFNTVSKGQARDMLKRVRGLIAEHRRTPEFHYSERNPSYLKLVMMEQALAAAATTPGAAPAANPANMAMTMQNNKKQAMDQSKQIDAQIIALQKQKADLMKQANNPMAEGRRARRLREASEIQQAQVVLASQDMVDQVQKMSEQVSAMQFKDLPALLDQIRNEVGVDQATQYNADASAALSGLLGNLQGAKQQLEAALGVITGQAPQVPGAEMGAAPDMGGEMPTELPAPGEEEVADLDAAGADLDAAAQAAGLGRERR